MLADGAGTPNGELDGAGAVLDSAFVVDAGENTPVDGAGIPNGELDGAGC